PDGRWLAYASTKSGGSEVYVRPYRGTGRVWQVSADGGLHPVWARDGRELFYLSHGRLFAVPVVWHPDFQAGRPKLLFSGPYHQADPFDPAAYGVTADAQRFLMLREEQDPREPQLVYVPDWFDELNARVPG